MDCANDPAIEIVTWVCCVQVGKTEVLLNIIGYHIDQDPCPILDVQANQKPMAETFSKDRLAPMIRDTKVLTGKVVDSLANNKSNTILHKVFPGGHITIAGANSPAGLASRPVRLVLCDEVDKYPASAGVEGDPIMLAEKRTTTFWNKQKWRVSTPTVEGTSRIDRSYEQGDMRRYYVPCPHCNGMQTLDWTGIKFDKEKGKEPDYETVHYECTHCQEPIEHVELDEMLRAGEWRGRKPFNGHASFHLSALYSPWVTWVEIVQEWFNALHDVELMKVWTNTVLGETFKAPARELSDQALMKSRTDYKVPETVLVTVCTVDIQADRIELMVSGWGAGELGWHLDKQIYYGDTSLPDVWEKLEAFITTETVTRDDGAVLKLNAIGIDSGFQTKMVYAFCKSTRHPRVYCLKGAGGEIPVVSQPVRSSKTPVPVHIVGTDTTKDILFNRLAPPSEDGMTFSQMLFFNLTCNDEYFAQLTAEKAVKKISRGFETREYVKTRPRNEILDLWTYALATLYILNPVWKALIPKVDENKPSPPPVTPAKQMQNQYMKGLKRQPRRGGFVGGWKK